MHPFEQYLQQHNLEALRVSVTAKVRYMTVYNALKNNPITPEHAEQIRQAVFTMTKIPYTGPFKLIVSTEDAPTISIKKLPRHNFL